MNVKNGEKIFALAGAEAVFTSCEYLKRYLTGFAAEDGWVIVDGDGTRLFTDARYLEAAVKCFQGTPVRVVEIDRFSPPEKLLSVYRNVAIPLDVTTVTEYEKIRSCGAEIKDATPAFKQAMAVKNAYELSCIRKACEIAEDAYLRTVEQIKEGDSEKDVAALLEYQMRKGGADGIAFDTIVAFGAHAAVPHHETGETRLAFGDEILIDFGCRVEGYCSDITRTVLFGDDGKHDGFKNAYQAVLDAHLKVLDKAESGMTAGQVDAIARDLLTERGYGRYFTHSLGHGIGLNVHEFPFVTKNREDVLQDGMVFSDEPGVYVAGEFGIRIEDTVALQDGKICSFMEKTQKKLVIL